MDKMTDNQQAMITHMFNRLRIHGPESRKAALAKYMGRPFTRLDEITKNDASKIISGLKTEQEALRGVSR